MSFWFYDICAENSVTVVVERSYSHISVVGRFGF